MVDAGFNAEHDCIRTVYASMLYIHVYLKGFIQRYRDGDEVVIHAALARMGLIDS